MDTITTTISNSNIASTIYDDTKYIYKDNYCEIAYRHDRFSFIQKHKNDITKIIAKLIENHNDNSLLFYKCEFLNDFLMKHKERKLPIDVATRFARCLTVQSDMLNQVNKAIFCMTLDCIVVINGDFPVFIDSNFITDIKSDNVVMRSSHHATQGETFSGIFNRLKARTFSDKIHSLFIGPEFVASYDENKKKKKAYSKTNAESDLYIDKDACNFAFGVLFVYLLFGFKKYMDFNDIYSVSSKALKPIENTAIYYFITRCLAKNPEERALLVL